MLFSIVQVGCAVVNSIELLIVFRLFAGIGGSAVLSVGGHVISDCFRREKMNVPTAAFGIGPLLGPAIGPVAYYALGSLSNR